jgi:hypothetical protein
MSVVGATTAYLHAVGMTLLLQFLVHFGFMPSVDSRHARLRGRHIFSARFCRDGLINTVFAYVPTLLLSATRWLWLRYV